MDARSKIKVDDRLGPLRLESGLPSMVKVDFEAAWQEPLDDVNDPNGPKTLNGSAHLVEWKITTQHDDDAVNEGEVIPINWQLKGGARPRPPVKREFLENMDSVCECGDPENVSVPHSGRILSQPLRP